MQKSQIKYNKSYTVYILQNVHNHLTCRHNITLKLGMIKIQYFRYAYEIVMTNLCFEMIQIGFHVWIRVSHMDKYLIVIFVVFFPPSRTLQLMFCCFTSIYCCINWIFYRKCFNNGATVPDLPINSVDWSLGPQQLGGLRPRCIILLILLLDFHTYAVITYSTF